MKLNIPYFELTESAWQNLAYSKSPVYKKSIISPRFCKSTLRKRSRRSKRTNSSGPLTLSSQFGYRRVVIVTEFYPYGLKKCRVRLSEHPSQQRDERVYYFEKNHLFASNLLTYFLDPSCKFSSSPVLVYSVLVTTYQSLPLHSFRVLTFEVQRMPPPSTPKTRKKISDTMSQEPETPRGLSKLVSELSTKSKLDEFRLFFDLKPGPWDKLRGQLNTHVQSNYSWTSLRDNKTLRHLCAEEFLEEYATKYWGDENREKNLIEDRLDGEDSACKYPEDETP